MSYFVDMLGRAEKMIHGQVDIDVIFKTNDRQGDGYAFMFLDDEGNYDVSLLQDRIPSGILNTAHGTEKVSEIFQEGKQFWSKEKTLLDAVNSVFNFWCVPDALRELCSIDISEGQIQLVLVEKSRK